MNEVILHDDIYIYIIIKYTCTVNFVHIIAENDAADSGSESQSGDDDEEVDHVEGGTSYRHIPNHERYDY